MPGGIQKIWHRFIWWFGSGLKGVSCEQYNWKQCRTIPVHGELSEPAQGRGFLTEIARPKVYRVQCEGRFLMRMRFANCAVSIGCTQKKNILQVRVFFRKTVHCYTLNYVLTA